MNGALPPPNDWKQFLKRLQHTPLRDLLRGKGATGRLDWKNTLTACALPGTMQAVVTQICKQRKLWPLEKVAVCHELIAHFQDGLDAGESADDLVKHFGDAQIAAKLIFRGKERQRPLWWHGFKWVSRGFLALVVVYAGLTVYYAMDRVVIKTDYLAEINAVAMATPESERAWPIYREALAKWPALREEEKWEEVGEDEEKRPANFAGAIWSYDTFKHAAPAWNLIARELAAHQEELDAFRSAAKMRHLGVKFGRNGVHQEDLAFFSGQSPPITLCSEYKGGVALTAPEILDSCLLHIATPQLSSLQQATHLLAADMRHAFAEKNNAKGIADLRAILGLARQLSQEQLLMPQLTAKSVGNHGVEALARALKQNPNAFDVHTLQSLAQLMRENPVSAFHLDGERAWFFSIIQMHYTDDGHGDGHFTFGGTRSGGIALITASRKEAAAMVTDYFDQLREEAAIPLWKMPGTPSQKIYESNCSADFFHPIGRFPFWAIFLPDLSLLRRNTARAQATHSALELGIALHRHRLAHHAFPQQLAELVPACLPQLPVDPITGGPLHYRLDEKGQPIVYSVGGDRQDDGGYAPVNRAGEDDTHATQRWENCEVKGDWILWPMSDRPLMK